MRSRAKRLWPKGPRSVAAEPGSDARPVDQAGGRTAARPVALIRSFATVSSYTMLSRLLGFVRDVMIAAILGAGPLADAFFVAFKLPNFLRRLFAEGAFNAGFVPLFAGTLEADGKVAARAFAEQAQAILLAILVPLVIVAIAAMPWVIAVMAPGFEYGGERYLRAVELSRITFVYILFISLVALQGGVLNSLGKFAAAAAAPMVLNLCLIGALLVSMLWQASPAIALAWGVAAAGLMQYLWLRVSVGREAMALGFRRPRWTPEIRRLFGLVLPGVLGAGVAQINLLADVFFASLLPAGAVSYLYYADRLNQLPLGVIGIAVGTALLPLLARQIRAGEAEAALTSQNRALELALLLTLPCCERARGPEPADHAGAVRARRVQRGRCAGDRARAGGLCAGPAGLRPGEGAGAGLLRAQGHQDAGQDRGGLPGRQHRPHPDPDLAAGRGRHRARDRAGGLA